MKKMEEKLYKHNFQVKKLNFRIHEYQMLINASVSELNTDYVNLHVISSYRIRDRDEGFLMRG